MDSSKFVGRVGGLAVALGVGAAIYNGTAVAWADDTSSGSTSHASTGRSAGSHASSKAATGANRAAGSPAAKSSLARRPGAAASVSAVRAHRATGYGANHSSLPDRSVSAAPSADPPTQATTTDSSATASQPADTAETLNAPVAAAALTAPALPEGTPVSPTETPLDWSLFAYALRQTTAAATAAVVQPAAAQNIALIMGGSGVPIPDADYIAAAFTKFVDPNAPAGSIPQQLVTPEGLYPITPYPYVKVLPLNTSVDQGNQILYDEILHQIGADNTLTVFGYSQSAIISSLVMNPDNAGCVNTTTCGIPSDAPVNFVLIGNEMNPNGGFLSRFPGLNLPSLGIPFYGGTPEDSFPVANYMREYDGFADFPQYPINFLADLNAALGIATVHGFYLELSQEEIDNAIELPTTSATQKYYVIPTADLPLVAPIRAIPVVGKPIADLMQPWLRVLVNLGYGDPKYGWSTKGDANVETPFGFLPHVNWGETVQLLVAGVQQGIKDFVADIKPGGSMWQDLGSHLSTASQNLASLPALTAGGIIPTIQAIVTGVSQFVSNAAASLYAALLPTADIVNAIVAVLPAYAFNLFLDGIQQAISGEVIAGLVNAIGLPWAASVGLVTTASLIEVLVVTNAITGAFKVA
ncbi:MAG: PE-PPE domain-containing protein [Mycobacterium sp.]|nr:PE-PPE domain-containing protein [Mycobacterium sp.]